MKVQVFLGSSAEENSQAVTALKFIFKEEDLDLIPDHSGDADLIVVFGTGEMLNGIRKIQKYVRKERARNFYESIPVISPQEFNQLLRQARAASAK